MPNLCEDNIKTELNNLKENLKKMKEYTSVPE